MWKNIPKVTYVSEFHQKVKKKLMTLDNEQRMCNKKSALENYTIL